MPVKEHLHQIQRDLYDRFRRGARRSVGNSSPALRKYFLEYQREFTDYTDISSRSELVRAFIQSDILVCGDYHTLPQAQRTVLRLLSEAVDGLKAKGRQPVLALEMLCHRSTPAAARYLEGEIDEAAFLTAIGFARNWGFAWENYRPLFELAREKGIRIVGLNRRAATKKPTLRQRDAFAARVLADALAADPRASLLAMMGDLHLAQSHLPAALERALARRGKVRRLVVVHQNVEKLYWKLAARGLEHEADVLKIKKNVFCVMNTPPWVKLQSYLRWLEWTADEDPASSPWDKGEFTESFIDLVHTVQNFVGIQRPVDDSFEILWHGEPTSPRAVKPSPFQKKFRRLLLESTGSLFVPGENTVWLTTPGVNSAATQAAVYLHARLSGRWRQFEFPRQDFYPTLWVEALGYLGSKIINPHRLCYGPEDYALAAKNNPVARRVSEHLQAERRAARTARFVGVPLPARVTRPDRALFYYRQARCLGQMLGAALYAAVVGNRVRAQELQSLFLNPFSDGKKARDLYLRWAHRLDEHGLRDALRRDRWKSQRPTVKPPR